MMKRIALAIAVLGLSAGAAFAATPASSPTAATQTQHSDWRANQETKALNLLEAQGFASFSDFRPVGHDHYAANVMQNGRNTTVQVNPQSGQIVRG